MIPGAPISYYRVHHGASDNPANEVTAFAETPWGYRQADQLCRRLNEAFRAGYRASQVAEVNGVPQTVWDAGFPFYFVTLIEERMP